jgi:hypothetical protein
MLVLPANGSHKTLGSFFFSQNDIVVLHTRLEVNFSMVRVDCVPSETVVRGFSVIRTSVEGRRSGGNRISKLLFAQMRSSTGKAAAFARPCDLLSDDSFAVHSSHIFGGNAPAPCQTSLLLLQREHSMWERRAICATGRGSCYSTDAPYQIGSQCQQESLRNIISLFID